MDGTKLRYQVSAIYVRHIYQKLHYMIYPSNLSYTLFPDKWRVCLKRKSASRVSRRIFSRMMVDHLCHLSFLVLQIFDFGNTFFLGGRLCSLANHCVRALGVAAFFLEPSCSLVLALGIFDQFLTQHGWMMIFHQHGWLMMSSKSIRFPVLFRFTSLVLCFFAEGTTKEATVSHFKEVKHRKRKIRCHWPLPSWLRTMSEKMWRYMKKQWKNQMCPASWIMSEFASFASAASPHGASRGHRLGALQARAKTLGNHTEQAMLYSVASRQHGFWALFCYWRTPPFLGHLSINSQLFNRVSCAPRPKCSCTALAQ